MWFCGLWRIFQCPKGLIGGAFIPVLAVIRRHDMAGSKIRSVISQKNDERDQDEIHVDGP